MREQIAADRANKSKEYEKISKEEREQKEELIRQTKNENLRLEKERLEEQRKMRDTMARIQVNIHRCLWMRFTGDFIVSIFGWLQSFYDI